MPAPSLPLQEWETFYEIIGSSAAALTGLMFVVVALSAQRRKVAVPGGAEALGSYATPTVTHFCAVVLLAAICATPRQTTGSLGACLMVMGVAGCCYSGLATWRAARQTAYAPVLEDWVWHSVLPLLAYLSLVIVAIVLRQAPVGALYGVEGAELLLLFIGIHNAWDAAVWIAASEEPPAEPPPSPPADGPG